MAIFVDLEKPLTSQVADSNIGAVTAVKKFPRVL
ncbi:hypothetical protein Godav_011683 [Gossypium davidsonii]|uniref:Uncharacterized protein n=1 Tax=Gossypium davidsonii TaxID=34287 RepID=A0A7J8RBH6_GOSDV|nr:hypothetical protein [Gossypium davidsonii]